MTPIPPKLTSRTPSSVFYTNHFLHVSPKYWLCLINTDCTFNCIHLELDFFCKDIIARAYFVLHSYTNWIHNSFPVCVDRPINLETNTNTTTIVEARAVQDTVPKLTMICVLSPIFLFLLRFSHTTAKLSRSLLVDTPKLSAQIACCPATFLCSSESLASRFGVPKASRRPGSCVKTNAQTSRAKTVLPTIGSTLYMTCLVYLSSELQWSWALNFSYSLNANSKLMAPSIVPQLQPTNSQWIIAVRKL